MFASYVAWRMSQPGVLERGGSVDVKRGYEILDGPYPKKFEDFVGQDRPKMQIMAAIASAFKRGEAMDHMLLASGMPGIGKTTLGRLTAAALGVGFCELGGVVTDKQVISALKVMQDGDVLFLDEVHRLVSSGKAKAEWLLTLLQDGSIQTGTGTHEAPKITVIAATTDAQRLPQTILDRFPIQPILEPYSSQEALAIARTSALRMGFGDGEDLPLPAETIWLERLARAADNNPRRIGSLLTTVRDIALATDRSNLHGDEGYDVEIALEWAGLTADGLTKGMQTYMVGLWTYGGTAGATTMKALVAEEQVGQTEKALIQKGYLVVTPRGRELTDYGLERAQELAKDMHAAHKIKEEMASE